MLSVYSEKHLLRDAKTELYGGELDPPVECPVTAKIGVNTVNVLTGFED